MNFLWSLTIGLFSLLLMGITNCSSLKRADLSLVSALEANDTTVIISGCGNQPVVGYTYCRVHEGQETASLFVSLHAPQVVCQTKPCVTFKIFFPQGQPAWGKELPEGKTQVDVSWKELTGSDVFVKDSQGFWQVLMQWNWLDTNTNEHQAAALGELRVRVLDAGYTSLNAIHDDPAFAWKWTQGIYHMALTTAGRSSVWGGLIP